MPFNGLQLLINGCFSPLHLWMILCHLPFGPNGLNKANFNKREGGWKIGMEFLNKELIW
jgi:hypothetical protein